MGWLSNRQRELFAQFLEPNPELNNHKGLETLRLSFYTSEMKAVSQIVTQVQDVVKGTFGQGAKDEKTKERYRNTLANLGLVTDDDRPTPLAHAVLDVVAARGWTAATLPSSGSELSDAIDPVIFRGVLDRLLDGEETKATRAILPLLGSVRLLVDAIPTAELATVADDLDLLFFLQSIHSIGHEIGRFFRLSKTVRDETVAEWKSAVASFPDTQPTSDVVERTAWTYLRPVAKKTLQADCRNRVHSLVGAYLAAQAELGERFPYVDRHGHMVRAVAVGPPRSKAANAYVLPPASSTPVAKPRQRLVSGCPGAGKSYVLQEDAKSVGNDALVFRTTFHSETSYFDFVGCYKPVPVYEQGGAALHDASGVAFPHGKPVIDYRYVPGPLVRALLFAVLNPTRTVVLIIEELNRANSGAVFGDVFQLLDRDGAGRSIYGIEPAPDLRAFLTAHGVAEGDLRLPENLCLWATMNSADQGVFPVDSAFRRRWSVEYLGHRTKCAYAADKAKVRYGGTDHDWDEFRGKINDALVRAAVHEDKLIGPYFLTIDELAEPQRVAYKLFLYLWDDVLRFQQDRLFNQATFAEVLESWNAGAGAPLKILTS